MITVTILINGKSIITRSAKRILGEEGELCKYVVDDGKTIDHHTQDGAVELSIKMLRGVHRI